MSKARAASVASGSGALETDGGNRDRMGDASTNERLDGPMKTERGWGPCFGSWRFGAKLTLCK